MLELQTDEDQVRFLLEKVDSKTEFIPWQRKFGTVTRTYKIYEKRKTDKGITTYYIRRGWTAYLINTFIQRISRDEYNDLLHDVIYSDSCRQFGFLVQLARTLPCHGRGREFKSPRNRQGYVAPVSKAILYEEQELKTFFGILYMFSNLKEKRCN